MRLFYLSLLSFVFVATSSLAVSKVILSKNLPFEPDVREEDLKVTNFPNLPVLVDNNPPPEITGQGAFALDLDSGVVLFEKNPDLRLLPASTTKIFTALVALDHYSLDQVLEVKDIGVDGQRMNLVRGEKIRVRDLLYGLLVFSANDAAEVLAVNFPGGRDSFIRAMNLKAKELNLENTLLSDPSGLKTNDHFTSARDLVMVASVAMRHPFFRAVVGTREALVSSADDKIVHRLRNINELVGKIDGVLGVKTGWTPDSKENLVTYIEKDNKRVMLAILGSQDRFGETKSLIDWIFSSYKWKKIQPSY